MTDAILQAKTAIEAAALECRVDGDNLNVYEPRAKVRGSYVVVEPCTLNGSDACHVANGGGKASGAFKSRVRELVDGV